MAATRTEYRAVPIVEQVSPTGARRQRHVRQRKDLKVNISPTWESGKVGQIIIE